MRRITTYIHNLSDWPHFTWDLVKINKALPELRHRQGKLMGKMTGFGFSLQSEASLQVITLDVLKSSEIEGEILPVDQVRSSVARRLGLEVASVTVSDRRVEGVVEMMLDATQQYKQTLTKERLSAWHSTLFPTGRSGMTAITVGDWRKSEGGPMQVVSGPIGKEKVHFEAPDATLLEEEINKFIHWVNVDDTNDLVLKAAIAHLWFITIHPFDDGNGRMARAITDMLLARSDDSAFRFYSLSNEIQVVKNQYYDILEATQKGNLDITEWLLWFFEVMNKAMNSAEMVLNNILFKAKFWQLNSDKPLNERQRLMLNKILDGFEGKVSTSKWAKITKSSEDTALRDIQQLINLEILIKEESGGRSTSYVIRP